MKNEDAQRIIDICKSIIDSPWSVELPPLIGRVVSRNEMDDCKTML